MHWEEVAHSMCLSTDSGCMFLAVSWSVCWQTIMSGHSGLINQECRLGYMWEDWLSLFLSLSRSQLPSWKQLPMFPSNPQVPS